MITVTLFGKPDCHLCEDAERLLERLQRSHPHHLRKVDITSLPAHDFERLRYRIPVVAVGTREVAAPFAVAQIESLLRQE